MLRGESTPELSGTTPPAAPARLEPPTIELEANVVEERESPQTTLSSSATPRRKSPAPFDSMKDFSGLRLRGSIRRAPPSTPDIAPKGGRFIEGTFSNAAGSRTYKLFIPSRYQGQPLPLIVMLHGCTQSPDDFAAGTRMNFLAEEQNCFVVYPEQPSVANQAKCWNWFRMNDQQRGKGEPSLIAGITRQIMREYSIDPKRVYACGLSAGGAAAAIMGTTYTDLYAAVGVHSGLACGAASDLPSALVAMRQGGGYEATGKAISQVPTIVFHGDRDTTVHPKNGDRVIEQSTKAKSSDDGSTSRSGTPRACLYPHRRYRRGRPRDFGALEYSRCRPRLVGRQSRRFLHRSGGAGREQRNAAFLPRAFAPGLVGVLRFSAKQVSRSIRLHHVQSLRDIRDQVGRVLDADR